MSQRLPIIAGNWKMNTTSDEAVALVETMIDELNSLNGVEMVVCPPFISLVPIRKILNGTKVQLGAQNIYWEEKGAYTGEISPLMLKPLCTYVIVGHSERRHFMYETDQWIELKARAALTHGLRPIICVGENPQQHDAGQTLQVVESQLNAVLPSFTPQQILECVIAYEPIWAIGTGRAATGKEAQNIIGNIREFLGDNFGLSVADEIRIQYGGSVTSENAADLLSQPDIDGALVGGASLKPDEFIKICKIAQQMKC